MLSLPETNVSANPPLPMPDERMRTGDPYFNYCWWPYHPGAYGEGKFRPSMLLYRVLQEMPHAAWMFETIQAIQRGLGDFRSVYGVKRVEGQWALEIYIYDYGRQERIVSIERLMTACGGSLKLPKSVDARIPYFMFSFDLTPAAAESGGMIDTVHVYVGNPGSTVSSGISYGFTADTRQLENFYFFFDAAEQKNEILNKITTGVFLDSWNLSAGLLLRPELMDCHTICLANKQTCDTVYFSGVNVDQFLFFLEWQRFPEHFVQYIRDNRHQLDHLLFDVGVDYRAVGGNLEFVKQGFYGVF